MMRELWREELLSSIEYFITPDANQLVLSGLLDGFVHEKRKGFIPSTCNYQH